MLRLCLLFLITWTATAQTRSTTPLELAEQMWAPFPAIDWMSEADVGQKGVTCRDRNLDFDYQLGLPDWSRVCISEEADYTATWGYYAYDWQRPARRQLPRLKLGISTNQQWFDCTYD